MSGGVDSSVAAYLLKKQGYSVVGVFMKCWSADAPLDKLGVNCVWQRDSEDARRVAEHLKIPFYIWDFEGEYKKKVVEYMVDGYRNGITPNPDVMCNKEIKFGLFLEKALAAGADKVATGHYVRLVERNANPRMACEYREYRGANTANKTRHSTAFYSQHSHTFANSHYTLFAAKDTNKDQSYFLWTLTQDQLKHCLFPIGDYLKPEVREIARKAGLPTAAKKDSQGICFLGQVTIVDFLKQYIVGKPGALVTTSGEKIGEHSGVEFYTIGQRHGVGVRRQASGVRKNNPSSKLQAPSSKPFYVAEKDLKTNTVVVAEGKENPALYRKEIGLTNIHFINPLFANSNELANKGLKVFARVRYRQPLAEAVLTRGEGPASPKLQRGERAVSRKGKFKLIFKTPQKFIASGQSAVFYSKKGEMLGGGVII